MNSNFQYVISETSRSLKIPLYVTLIIEIISNLQIVSIILDNAFDFNIETNDVPSRFARHISSFLSSIEFLTSDANQALLQTIWICFAVYLSILILWVILLTVIRHRSPMSLRKIFFETTSIAYLVHSRIIFFIIQFFFMGLIDSYTECDETDEEEAFQCQSVWFGFTVLFCLLNFGVALFKELILYDINKTKRNTYAVKCNTFHKLLLLHKALAITIYFIVQDPSTTRQINAAINTILLFASLLILYFKLPFYSIVPMKASIMTTGIAFWLSIISVLGVAGVNKGIIGIVWVALTPLIVKILLIIFNQLSYQIMQGDFHSPERAIHFIRLLNADNFGFLTPSIYSTTPIYLGGIISNGILAQRKADMEALMDSKSKKEHEEKIYSYMLDKLNPILDKNPTSELLLLFMAKIYFKKLENIPKAITLLKRVEALSLSIPVRNSVDAFNIKVMETYLRHEYEGNNNKLNLLEYFKERALANSVKDDIQYEVYKHAEFWEELRKDRTNVRKIIELAGNIEVVSAKIFSKWQNQIHGHTTHILNPLIMYSAYLEIIREQSDEAKKLLQRFWNLSNNPHNGHVLDVYADEDAVVLVSLEKTNHGVIIEASGSAQILFGREKNMLIGQSVGALVPSIIGDSLLKLLENYTVKPVGKLDYKVKSFGKTLSGEFFEAEIHMKLFPEVSRQVRIMIIFNRLSTYKPLIIADRNGNILDCTDSLKQTFDFGKTVAGGVINMKKIAPAFEIINEAFNYMHDHNKHSKENMPKSPKAEPTPTKILEKRNSLHHLSLKTESPNVIRHKPGDQEVIIDDIALEGHKNVYEEYMQGSKLKFNILHKSFEQGNNDDDTFEVQITPFEFNNKIYKIIALTLQEEKKNASKVFAKEITTINVETLFSDFAADFPEENERNEEELGANKKFKTHLTLKPQFQEGSLGFDRRLTRLTDNTEDNSKMPKIKTLQSSTPVKKDESASEAFIKKAKLDFRENSVSSTSSRTVASIRALKSLFNKSQSYTLARRTSLVIFAIMVAMIVLAAISFVLSRNAIGQVQTGVTIINYASLRLSQSLRTWQVATRFFLRKAQLRSGQIQTLKDAGYTSSVDMLNQNKELMKQLSMNIDESFVREIGQADVSLWIPYENKTLSGDQVNTFMAANTLANNMLRVTNTTDDTESAKILNYIQFVANNSGNDYLIASEDVITSTQQMLQVLIQDNISNLQVVLGLQITALFALCSSLIIALRVVLQSYRKLFRALVKIDEKNINNRLLQIHKIKELLAEDLDTKKFGTTALQIMRPNEKQSFKMKAKSMKKGGFHKIEEKMDIKGLLSQLIKYIGFSFLIVQIITVLFITSLLKSITNFRSLETVNNQLSVTTRVAYQSSAVISIFYVEILWRNDTTMLVRNELPAYQVEKSIQALTNVNNDLVSVFSESGSGITDPLINEVLQASVCKFLDSDATLQGYCDTATAGGDLGILGVNSKFYMTAQSYKNIYFSNPTYDTAKSIIDAYVAVMRPAAETIEAALEFINNHILSNFNNSIDEFTTQTAFLHLGILLAIIFSTYIIQTIGVLKVRSLDMCRGIILRVMPINVLLEDKAIAFYLNRHFISTNNAISQAL